jgi:CheY-like chemotaxis protein
VEGDPVELEQCLMNLCLNAFEAMPEGGELLVVTRRLDLDEAAARARALRPGLYCVLAVRDQGTGIEPATLARLGRPFFSTKAAGGRGLGLTVVHTVVQAHGGAIEFRSQSGQGTEVELLLPASPHPPAEPAPGRARRRQASRSRGETILVVDDDRWLRQMSKRLLRSLGYQVLLAATGEEALATVARQPERIDLVLLDLLLGDMEGLEALRRLRELCPSVRVLVCSGLARSEVWSAAEQHGACGFLAKPYGMDEVGEAIRRALASGSA